MNEKKIENILSLDDKERYKYLIRKVTDFEELWLIKNDVGKIQTNFSENQTESIPIWPEKEFAELSFMVNRKSFVAESIDLYEFMKLCENLNEKGIQINVFPGQNLKSIKINPLEFKKQLKAECEQYE